MTFNPHHILEAGDTSIRDLKKRDDTLPMLQTALQESRHNGDKSAEATLLNNIALFLDNSEEAFHYYLKALDIQRELGNSSGEAVVLANIASACAKIAAPQKGMPYAQDSLQIAQAVGNLHYQVVALNLLGLLTRQLGRHQQALPFCEQAYALATQSANKLDQINTLAFMAQLYMVTRDPQKAIAMYDQALTIVRKTEYRLIEFDLMTQRIYVYVERLKDFEKAVAYHQESIAFAEKLGEADALALAYSSYAETLRQLGKDHLNEALLYAKKGHDTLTSNNLTHDRGGRAVELYALQVTRLYALRDNWLYKIFPFLR
ncbi:MAG: tetratricopeptide repeat protein [bacterium]|nr:tetratricopeptide repeat protein [bacterium]